MPEHWRWRSRPSSAAATPVAAQSPAASRRSPAAPAAAGRLDAGHRGAERAARRGGRRRTAPSTSQSRARAARENCIEQPELGHMCFGPSGAISKVEGGDGDTGRRRPAISRHHRPARHSVPRAWRVASDGTIWYHRRRARGGRGRPARHDHGRGGHRPAVQGRRGRHDHERRRPGGLRGRQQPRQGPARQCDARTRTPTD